MMTTAEILSCHQTLYGIEMFLLWLIMFVPSFIIQDILFQNSKGQNTE